MSIQRLMQQFDADTAIQCDSQFIAVSSRNQSVAIKSSSGGPSTYRFDQVISADLEIQNSTQSRTTGGRSVTGALAGAFIAGPAGLIVGGLGGRKVTNTQEWISCATVSVTIRVGDNVVVLKVVIHRASAPTQINALENTLNCAANIVATLREAQNLATERNAEIKNQQFNALDIVAKAEILLQTAGWRTQRVPKEQKEYFDLLLAVKDAARAVIACVDYVNEYDLTRTIGPRLESFTRATERAILANRFSDINRIAGQRQIQLLSLTDLQSFGARSTGVFTF